MYQFLLLPPSRGCAIYKRGLRGDKGGSARTRTEMRADRRGGGRVPSDSQVLYRRGFGGIQCARSLPSSLAPFGRARWQRERREAREARASGRHRVMGAGFGEELQGATRFLPPIRSACVRWLVRAGVRARRGEARGRAHTKFEPAGAPRSGSPGSESGGGRPGARGPGRRRRR